MISPTLPSAICQFSDIVERNKWRILNQHMFQHLTMDRIWAAVYDIYIYELTALMDYRQTYLYVYV